MKNSLNQENVNELTVAQHARIITIPVRASLHNPLHIVLDGRIVYKRYNNGQKLTINQEKKVMKKKRRSKVSRSPCPFGSLVLSRRVRRGFKNSRENWTNCHNATPTNLIWRTKLIPLQRKHTTKNLQRIEGISVCSHHSRSLYNLFSKKNARQHIPRLPSQTSPTVAPHP